MKLAEALIAVEHAGWHHDAPSGVWESPLGIRYVVTEIRGRTKGVILSTVGQRLSPSMVIEKDAVDYVLLQQHDGKPVFVERNQYALVLALNA
jgi:hypothetical protein